MFERVATCRVGRLGVSQAGTGVLVLVVMLVAVAGCVGPSRSDQDYREKAANTAQAVRSAVETAQLVVRGAGEGKAPGRYVGRALADVESDVSSVSTAFSSIQPPSSAVDQLRSDLTSLLDECSSVLAQLRIVARRGELSQLPAWAEPLPGLAAPLARFQTVAGT